MLGPSDDFARLVCWQQPEGCPCPQEKGPRLERCEPNRQHWSASAWSRAITWVAEELRRRALPSARHAAAGAVLLRAGPAGVLPSPAAAQAPGWAGSDLPVTLRGRITNLVDLQGANSHCLPFPPDPTPPSCFQESCPVREPAKKFMVNPKALSHLHHWGREADAFCPPSFHQPQFLPLVAGAAEVRHWGNCCRVPNRHFCSQEFQREVKAVKCSLGWGNKRSTVERRMMMEASVGQQGCLPVPQVPAARAASQGVRQRGQPVFLGNVGIPQGGPTTALRPGFGFTA